MKLQYSPYSLLKKKKVNALDQTQTQQGALIRVCESESLWGVADLCPWPSLGDNTLEVEIEKKAALFQRAIELATEDLQARQQKKSLLQNKWVDNNILVSNYSRFDFNAAEWAGHTLKIKGDQKIFHLIEVLQAAPKSLVFRIDFNATLKQEEFQLFLNNISPTVQIEYIEDPCAYNEELWLQWNRTVPLAADFIQADQGFSVQIVKPSRERLEVQTDFVITSSMDHPVGVAHALRTAQNQAQKKSGLLTLDLYEATPFHSYFIYKNQSEINFSENALKDFGIGMSEELSKLNWKDLP